MIYDYKAWEKDGIFNAAPGQEITEEIYDAMLNGVPPLRLFEEAVQMAYSEGLCVFAGFLMGESDSRDEKGSLYLAFGMNHDKCYYIGLCHK